MGGHGKKGCVPCLVLPNEAKLRGDGRVQTDTHGVMILVTSIGEEFVAVYTATIVSDTVGIFFVKMLGNKVNE